jgi:curved DNA-binding protein CbpA
MNPYEELGIGKNAPAAEVRRAYRGKARKAHPDQGGTREEFDRLTQAHLVLSDPVRRAKFDETGKIEDVSSDIGDQAAFQEISAILSHLLLQELEVPDLKGMLISLLRQKKDHIEGQANPLKRAAARAEKVKGRFKRRGDGENVIASMIEWQRRQWVETADKLNQQADILKRAIEVVREYDFEVRPAANPGEPARARSPAFFGYADFGVELSAR